jgi:hypothetical protein
MDPFDPAHPQYNLNMLAATSVARLHRELVGFDKQAAPMREYLETMPYRQLRRPETVQQYVRYGSLSSMHGGSWRRRWPVYRHDRRGMLLKNGFFIDQ